MKALFSPLLTLLFLNYLPFLAHAQWTSFNPGFTQATGVAGLSAPGNQVLWVAGRDTSQNVSGNRFARTTDGGQTWSQFVVTGFPTYTPSNISAINADTAWVAMFNSTGGGGIFRTNNGGVSWTQQTTATFTAPNGFPNFVHFFDATNGVCMGDPNGGYFEIYTTANGGTTWARVAQTNIPTNLTGEYGTVNEFSASGNGVYFNTTSGRVFSSTNKGLTWATTPVIVHGDTAYSYWVAAKTATEALVVTNAGGSSQLARTVNGGQTWTSESFEGFLPTSNASFIKGGGNSSYLLAFSGNDVRMSYDDGKHFIPFSGANIGVPASVYEGAAATVNGIIWLGGRSTSLNGGLMKYTIPKKDIAAASVVIGANKTSCFNEDTIFAMVKNTGSDTLRFSATPLVLTYNFYERPAIDPNFIFNSYVKVQNTGTLLPGESRLLPWTNAPTVHKNFERYIQVVASLSDSVLPVAFNDTSLFTHVNGIISQSLTNVSTGLSATAFYRGDAFVLNCSGSFSTIQWQKRSVSGTWTNITGADSATYTFYPTASAYYRALLCGTLYTDSLPLLMLEGNVVGYTYYDNQSNASVNNRIQLKGNTIVGVFTGSMDPTNSATGDRGSFYNAATNGKWGTPATSRIESLRTGFSSIALTKGGKEVIVAHNATTAKLVLSRRDSVGGGIWTETVDFAKGMWPRIAAGNGDTIHIIALDTSISAGAKIRYYRSPNAGLSWDIAIDLPGYTVANGFATTTAETYAIQTKGNIVAIIAGGSNNKTAMWKSTNSGQTWTNKTIKTFPAGFDGNTITPRTASTDGIHSVLIDLNDQVNVFTGNMFMQDDIAGDDSWLYFPNSDGLLYWKESWATDSLVEIASAAQTGYIEGAFVQRNDAGLCSFASSSIHQTTGAMYVTFSVPINNTSDSASSVNRSDLFGIMSLDGGAHWSVPQNLTLSAATGYDNSYGSTANNSADSVHLLWQSSTTPVARNDGRINLKPILHQPFAYSRFESITLHSLTNSAVCGNDSITVSYSSVGSFGSVSVQLSDINGSFASPTVIGSFANSNLFVSRNISISNSHKTGTYLVRVVGSSGIVSPEQFVLNITQVAPKPVVGNTRPLTFCNGDSTVLTIDTAQTGTFNHIWIVNGAMDSSSYNMLKYTVKSTANVQVVVNPFACSTASDTIKVVRNNNVAISVNLTPDTLACMGTALTLKAIVLTGTPTSYEWRKGATVIGTNSSNLVIGSVLATSAGKYSITINSQCAAYHSDTIDVGVNKAPVITQQPASISVCEGNIGVLRLQATSLTPLTYQWKKGTQLMGTDDSLVIYSAAVTDTGAYTCTVTNACGSASSQSVMFSLTEGVRINTLLPDTLLCKGSAFTYTLNYSGPVTNFAWYHDTTLVGTGSSLIFSAISLNDSGTYLARIQNECSISISNFAYLSVSDAATVTIAVASGDTLVAAVSGSYSSVRWYLNDSLITGAGDTMLVANQSGTYQAIVHSTGGCENRSAPLIHFTTGLPTSKALAAVRFYPNPANTGVHISGLDQLLGTLSLTDVLGKTLFTMPVIPTGMVVDVSTVTPGIYFLRIQSPDGAVVRKIQVQH
jgi:hypothetical protein